VLAVVRVALQYLAAGWSPHFNPYGLNAVGACLYKRQPDDTGEANRISTEQARCSFVPELRSALVTPRVSPVPTISATPIIRDRDESDRSALRS
jgi:hypothetical protein